MVRTWIGTDRGTNGKTQVTFVWEPIPRTPGDRPRESDVPARVSLTAVAPDGSPVFRGRIPDSEPTASAASNAPSRVSFEAPPDRPAVSRKLVLAAVAAVVVLGGGYFAFNSFSRSAPKVETETGTLVVTSNPDGVAAFVDGEPKGMTPVTLTLSAGPHVVEVRSGTGEPRVIPLVIRANVQTAQYVELQEAVPVPPPVERRAPSRRR